MIGAEVRRARTQLGLSIEMVARAIGISPTELSRIERGLAPLASVLVLSRLCAVVGLDLAVRAYPGGVPLRDARHGRQLAKLKGRIHPALSWTLEAPLPNRGDQRAWDALIRGDGWRYGVECELNPIDGQALLRRVALKQRDGMVNGVVLLLPDTRQARLFRREYAAALEEAFPVPGSVALARLAAGKDPGGSAIITP